MTIRVLLVAALLFAASAAFAKDIAYARPEAGVVIVLTDQRSGCDWNSGATRVRLDLKDKQYFGCYIVANDEILIVWDDGDVGRVPASLFQPAV